MFTNYKYYTNNKNVVVAVSTYAGKKVRGVAKCAPEDKFDLDDGKALAAARCNEKIAYLRYKRAMEKNKAAYHELAILDKKIKDINDYLDNSRKAYIDAQNKLKNLEARF